MHELIHWLLLLAIIIDIVTVLRNRRAALPVADAVLADAERLACDAIAFAEERGRARAKALGTVVAGSEKLSLAARYFREHASDQVLALVRGHVLDWLEAKLGLLRGIPLEPGVAVAQTVPRAGARAIDGAQRELDITLEDTQPARPRQ